MERKLRIDIIPHHKTRGFSLRFDTQTGTFTLRHHPRAKQTQIQEFLAGHTNWIEEKMARREASLPTLGAAWLPLDGVFFKSFLHQHPKISLDVEHQKIKIPFSRPGTSLLNHLKDMADKTLNERLCELGLKMGMKPNGVRIKDTKSRWGSCSIKGNIALSFRLIMMPRIIRDYVMIHELCHLKHMNHSPDFWALVKQFDPDYRYHRGILRENATKWMAVDFSDQAVRAVSHQIYDE